jgi:hypothetical protein
MLGDEFSAANLFFEAARGELELEDAGQIVWIATVFFRQSCRFAQARVASLEKTRHGPCSVYFGRR